jgi:hypothetical protein
MSEGLERAHAPARAARRQEAGMRRTLGLIGVAMLVLAATHAGAVDITPGMQKEIDRHVEVIKAWAADPVVLKAVAAQNEKGPMDGIDNAKWKTMRRSDAVVKEFQASPAGQYLTQKIKESNGSYIEAFLSAAQGEKVAFFEKTTSYIHKGQPKFEVPFGTGKPWQGKPEFDESTQSHQIQIAVPVLAGGKPVGVLVVGLNLGKLEKLTQK